MEEMYQQYSQIVFHFLLSRCRDPVLAEDLTQETFLAALNTIGSYDGSCKLSTWLCQIAKHLLYRHWEKSSRVQFEELDETMESGNDTERQAITRIELEDVWERLQNLSPDMRKAVELRVLGGLSYREIGDMMGKSENWARVTFYRAKLMLANAIPSEAGKKGRSPGSIRKTPQCNILESGRKKGK